MLLVGKSSQALAFDHNSSLGSHVRSSIFHVPLPSVIIVLSPATFAAADTLESMLLPENVERIIFKTDSTTK